MKYCTLLPEDQPQLMSVCLLNTWEYALLGPLNSIGLNGSAVACLAASDVDSITSLALIKTSYDVKLNLGE